MCRRLVMALFTVCLGVAGIVWLVPSHGLAQSQKILAGRSLNVSVDEVDRQDSPELQVVGGVEEFGVQAEFQLMHAVGMRLDRFCESGVLESMLLSNIDVQFRHQRKGKESETKVVAVYPRVFTANCIVVVEVDGPIPRN